MLYYSLRNSDIQGLKVRMYYEEYEPRAERKRRRRRRRHGGCMGAIARFFTKLIVFVIVLALLTAGILYMLPTALFMIEPEAELSLTDGLPSTPFNVLLLGVDVLNDGAQRSDTMMIASIDGKKLRLTSIQRDMMADIPGHGRNRINAAYAFGGPELAMRTVNEALDLNVMRYVVVDFTVLVKLVDALGGVEMNISEAEMNHINQNVWKSRRVFAPLGYTAEELTEYGENIKLNGLRALGYARIRKLDSDFMRTSRQRAVIKAMLKKLKSQLWNPAVVAEFVATGLRGVETNLSPIELISLGEKALFSAETDQLRLPVDGSFDDNGSSLTVTDRLANIARFRNFVYGG